MTAVLLTDHDADAAQWLRNLAEAGVIQGDTMCADIHDLTGADLDGYRRVHLFSGIGGWEEACRIAGWPDGLELWTGSCPCQPFSVAGAGLGTDDPRHLWPQMRRLIAERRPSVVAGEQVASKAGRAWLSGVRADLEELGYAVGAADLCAAGVGAPHIRQRLFWVAERMADGQGIGHEWGRIARNGRDGFAHDSAVGIMADADDTRSQGRSVGRDGAEQRAAWQVGVAGWLADSASRGQRADRGSQGQAGHDDKYCKVGWAGQGHGGWSSPDWLWCRDDKWRPTQPGTFPLAPGLPRGMGRMRAALERLGLAAKHITRVLRQPSSLIALSGKNRTIRLRGYGNSIVPELAAAFLSAYIETRHERVMM